MQITNRERQWLGDIAVREAGSIEAVVEMAIVKDVSITDKPLAGSLWQEPAPSNRQVMNYYNTNGIYPATSMESGLPGFGGIGYMAVEITFIVS